MFLTSTPALFPASFTEPSTLSKLPAAPPSPLRSLPGRLFSEATPAVSGATALDSSGSPLAFFSAALSLLYAKVPARPP